MLKQRHMPKKRRGWFQWRTPQEQVKINLDLDRVQMLRIQIAPKRNEATQLVNFDSNVNSN